MKTTIINLFVLAFFLIAGQVIATNPPSGTEKAKKEVRCSQTQANSQAQCAEKQAQKTTAKVPSNVPNWCNAATSSCQPSCCPKACQPKECKPSLCKKVCKTQ